jgi:hypothetical protein
MTKYEISNDKTNSNFVLRHFRDAPSRTPSFLDT